MATTIERAFYASHSQDWVEREAQRCRRRSVKWIEAGMSCCDELCWGMGWEWVECALNWNATACELKGFEVSR